MSSVAPVIKDLAPDDGSVKKFTWTLAGAADTGESIPFAQWADRSVQFAGTWGGGTIVWQGSNDAGTTWFTLTDAQTTAISKTADALEQVVEMTELARPKATSQVTGVVVTCVARRQQPMRK